MGTPAAGYGTGMTLSMLTWNCGERPDAWDVAARDGLDVVLLQRAPVSSPPAGWRLVSWAPSGPWGTALAVRDGVDADPVPLAPLDAAKSGQLGVSLSGSLAVALLRLPGEEPLHVASAYATWEDSLDGRWGYPDAAAHRVVSDLSALVGENEHRLVAAGDWNVTREGAEPYWQARYDGVFTRLDALGLALVGPFGPGGATIPTYKEQDGSGARQLDFVLASRSLAGHVRTGVVEDMPWSADHRAVTIELGWSPPACSASASRG